MHEGLVGIADTRVLSGSECITARKVTVYQENEQPMFVMTSGLRSLRDKALTYFAEVMAENEQPFDRRIFAELAASANPNGASPV